MKKEYKEYYIAFLDMLGFKNLIRTQPFEKLINIFEKIRYPYNVNSKTIDFSGKDVPNSEKAYRINTKIISDSICLYIEADESIKLFLLISTCCIIQWELLNCDTPIFVRGGVVKGYMYSDGDVIFGEGLTRAYLLEEENARYPRIIMTNNILQPLRTPDSQNGKTTIEHIVFKDFDGFYTVDYFNRLINYKKNLKVMDRVLKHVNAILDSTTDPSLREKYNYFLGTLMQKGKSN